MLCAYPIGKILGFILQKGIDHYIQDFKAKYPIPDEYADDAVSQQAPVQQEPQAVLEEVGGGAQGMAA